MTKQTRDILITGASLLGGEPTDIALSGGTIVAIGGHRGRVSALESTSARGAPRRPQIRVEAAAVPSERFAAPSTCGVKMLPSWLQGMLRKSPRSGPAMRKIPRVAGMRKSRGTDAKSFSREVRARRLVGAVAVSDMGISTCCARGLLQWLLVCVGKYVQDAVACLLSVPPHPAGCVPLPRYSCFS